MASAKLNSEIAVDFRDKLQRGLINFLVNENDAESYLTKNNKEYSNSKDINLRVWYTLPYIEIELLANETINLEYSVVSGNIKLETSGTARKDRYTSCSYGNFVASLLELDFLKNGDSDYDFVFTYS